MWGLRVKGQIGKPRGQQDNAHRTCIRAGSGHLARTGSLPECLPGCVSQGVRRALPQPLTGPSLPPSLPIWDSHDSPLGLPDSATVPFFVTLSLCSTACRTPHFLSHQVVYILPQPGFTVPTALPPTGHQAIQPAPLHLPNRERPLSARPSLPTV